MPILSDSYPVPVSDKPRPRIPAATRVFSTDWQKPIYISHNGAQNNNAFGLFTTTRIRKVLIESSGNRDFRLFRRTYRGTRFVWWKLISQDSLWCLTLSGYVLEFNCCTRGVFEKITCLLWHESIWYAIIINVYILNNHYCFRRVIWIKCSIPYIIRL